MDSTLSLNHLYLLTLYLIPTAQRMTVRYIFLFLDTLNFSSFLLPRAIWGVFFLRICHLTETRAMGTVQSYTFKAKENRFTNHFISLHIENIHNYVDKLLCIKAERTSSSL